MHFVQLLFWLAVLYLRSIIGVILNLHWTTSSITPYPLPTSLLAMNPLASIAQMGSIPYGISLVPWKQGKVLVWDATWPDTFAPSHLPSAAMSSGAVAQQAKWAKRAKYAHLDASHSIMSLCNHSACSINVIVTVKIVYYVLEIILYPIYILYTH